MNSTATPRLITRHLRIMDLHLAGVKHADIAQEMGCTAPTVSKIVRSPLFQQALAKRRDELTSKIDTELVSSVSEAKERLEQAALEAARTQIELMDSDDERVAHMASASILDRVGIGKRDKDGRDVSVTVISADIMNNLVVALEEAG